MANGFRWRRGMVFTRDGDDGGFQDEKLTEALTAGGGLAGLRPFEAWLRRRRAPAG